MAVFAAKITAPRYRQPLGAKSLAHCRPTGKCPARSLISISKEQAGLRGITGPRPLCEWARPYGAAACQQPDHSLSSLLCLPGGSCHSTPGLEQLRGKARFSTSPSGTHCFELQYISLPVCLPPQWQGRGFMSISAFAVRYMGQQSVDSK